MARINILSFTILFALIAQCSVCVDLPEASPSPSPDSGSFTLPSNAEAPASPSPQLESDSDIASPPSDLAPAPSSTDLKHLAPVPAPEISNSPSPGTSSANYTPLAPGTRQAPVSAPEVASDIRYVNADDNEEKHSSSGGHKAGIAIGVVFGACIVGVGGKVYKKRRDNIRRSRYAYSTREDFL